MSSDARREPRADRRNFLKFAGASAVTGAASVIVAAPAEAAKPAVEAGTSSGYRESEHVKRYYALLRQF